MGSLVFRNRLDPDNPGQLIQISSPQGALGIVGRVPAVSIGVGGPGETSFFSGWEDGPLGTADLAIRDNGVWTQGLQQDGLLEVIDSDLVFGGRSLQFSAPPSNLYLPNGPLIRVGAPISPVIADEMYFRFYVRHSANWSFATSEHRLFVVAHTGLADDVYISFNTDTAGRFAHLRIFSLASNRFFNNPYITLDGQAWNKIEGHIKLGGNGALQLRLNGHDLFLYDMNNVVDPNNFAMVATELTFAKLDFTHNSYQHIINQGVTMARKIDHVAWNSSDWIDAPTADVNPAQVTDLQVLSSTETSVTVGWTAVADGIHTASTRYDLRYATNPISWGSATSVSPAPNWGAQGTSLQYTITGLSPGTSYQFQLVSYRGQPNTAQTVFGELSNIATGSTGSSPDPGGGTVLFKTSWTPAEGWGGDVQQIPCGGGYAGHQAQVSNWGNWQTWACGEIILAASYPGGAGGRGFRLYRGAGTNSVAGSPRIDIAPTTALCYRWYARYAAGFEFAGGAPHYTKDIYWHVDGGGSLISGFHDGWLYTHVSTHPGQNVDTNDRWETIQGGNLGSGAWHQYEVCVDFANGILRMWRDGTIRLDRNDIVFTGFQPLTWLELGENQNFVIGNHYTDFDELVIRAGTVPIGLYQGGRNY